MSVVASESSRVAPTQKGEARRQRLLETAADAFLEFGYADVSMQEIVRQAGGSASTAYQLFGNKEGLLIAVLQRELEQLRNQVFAEEVFALPVAQALEAIAQRMVAHSVQQRSVQFYRLVMAECHRLEKMSDYLRQQVAIQIYHPLERCLRAACARGELQIDDPEQAARMLGNLINGIAQEARLEGGYANGPAERDRQACSYSIHMFLRAYRST
ncbi:TetR/AcrR family transcriptional regulator [Herminiimonas contaminans]|uniref:TetR/AcrR family transcriptional regulator n=1 Tax=Herminiimonas contaminans TaxID=1111140 RepID=A0ABS0ESS7_9BURK|nr:TetR/AcrR family transcriptional regulator [Herminiimonas contaminans]MBF8176912.1 TetR/AcrR family transcriptional regulator [Herminiimonas contaminans]